jgi:4'-phosphopantetheinyl transferase
MVTPMEVGSKREARCEASGLAAGEVHVWRASLQLDERVISDLEGVLAADERDRARRLRLEQHRSRFIAARGLLRLLLGCYVGMAADELVFSYGAFGKPRLAAATPAFNLAHSDAVALYAFTNGADVGIDVEVPRRRRAELMPVAERFFSPGEVRALRAVAAEHQQMAFLACWTRKEAFIKARGDGLSLPLDSFDVTLAPGQPAALTRTAWSADEPEQWRLMDLTDPAAGYVAAVAMRGDGGRLVRRRVLAVLDRQLRVGPDEYSAGTA